MNDLTQSRWLPIVLLVCSNFFMTCAWYGHLKYKGKPLLLVILVSWAIARERGGSLGPGSTSPWELGPRLWEPTPSRWELDPTG